MTAKILVIGTMTFEPEDRETFIEAFKAEMARVRAEDDGCEEFVVAADPIEPGRVVITQQWRDRAALDAHIAGERGGGGVTPNSMSVEFHTVASTEKVV
jgi:quinol monooxygenase YgiN